MSRPDWRAFRTVRCILRQDERFLLVVHHQRFPGGRPRWGLPGGRIERGEDLATTARRELREELSVQVADLAEVGDYRYKGALNRVYASEFSGRILSFDRSELKQIAWHSLDDVVQLAGRNALHAGFEANAIHDYLQQLGVKP
ncbi:MAG: NUDIX hydrolase [Gammaproteobacteria bacterium]|nr:NUDIX hydrolase [Gammaproteobacteria bacterium]